MLSLSRHSSLSRFLTLITFKLLLLNTGSTAAPPHPVEITVNSDHKLTFSSLANIHVVVPPRLLNPPDSLKVTYGDCGNAHHDDYIVGSIYGPDAGLPTELPVKVRLTWPIPQSSSARFPRTGCLSAWNSRSSALVGRSGELSISEEISLQRGLKKKVKRGTTGIMDKEHRIDTLGPWFDGVMMLKGRNSTEVDEDVVKQKRIGIVGGGMAGLMTGLLLDSVGLKNWHILEADDRIGGRVRTVYFNGSDPGDYEYQEMGPMRFPVAIRYNITNETLPINDQKILFQLASTLNTMNKNSPDYAVKFIPWYQVSPTKNEPWYWGGIRKKNGDVPTVAETETFDHLRYNPEKSMEEWDELKELKANIRKVFTSEERLKGAATDMYRTHKKFIEEGWDDWSEFGYIHNLLKYDLNVTDLFGGLQRLPTLSFWIDIFEQSYFSAITWRTIDKGVNRLPNAFRPHLKNRISFNRKIAKVSLTKTRDQVKLSWKVKPTHTTYQTEPFDYAIVTVPFTQVRKWRFDPLLPSTINRAIQRLRYTDPCKVALHFKSRWWEHIQKPTYGGCSSTDIPGIESFCYPSHGINKTGPGVLLAAYSMSDSARMISLPEKEHVQYTLDAMAEIHGEEIVRNEYTGKYSRKCWLLDEHVNGGWAEPSVGQHKLYMPQYFKTHNRMIFVGEHTSFSHSWIASSLESAIRGTVQLLLELGLVDEAKQITKEWMGRWIKI